MAQEWKAGGMTLMETAVELAAPELVTHVVGLRFIAPCGTPARWRDIRYMSIELAQERYDKGEVEMCQGRGIDKLGRHWCIQYAIPRRQRREVRCGYFGTREAA